jgi:iron(III) transport system substrate-binding protein
MQDQHLTAREGIMIAARWLGALLVGLVVASAAGTGSAHADLKAIEEAARKEGEITWYVASIDARNAEEAGRQFTARYAIKVNVLRAASQIMYQRLAQDLSQGVAIADVFSSVDVGNFVTLKKSDQLAAYVPENAARLLPVFQGFDPDGFFQSTVAAVIAIAYNSQKVKADEVPKTWTDLLNPKWTDKLALGHPAFSGFAGSWAAAVYKLYGKSYFEQLERLRPQVSRSLLDATTLLNSGERLVAATPIAPIVERADKGAPLAIQYPSDGAILIATPSAVLKNAPHPNAARLFMEYLLGVEFNRVLVKARYESMRADVPPLPGVKSVSDIKVIRPTTDDIVRGIPEVSELWRNIFGQ